MEIEVLCIGGPWHGRRLPVDVGVVVPHGYRVEPSVELREWVLVHHETFSGENPPQRDEAS